MPDEKQEQTEQPDITKQAFAGIMFEKKGSANLRVVLGQVTPEQVLLAGAHLSAIANRMLNDQWTQNQIREAHEKQQMVAMMNKGGLRV